MNITERLAAALRAGITPTWDAVDMKKAHAECVATLAEYDAQRAPEVAARVIIGAASAYACITAAGCVSLDVKLSAGKSASASLRESADETRERADRLLRQAAMMQAAADYLECAP